MIVDNIHRSHSVGAEPDHRAGNAGANLARRCQAWFRNKLCCCVVVPHVRRDVVAPGNGEALVCAATTQSDRLSGKSFENPAYEGPDNVFADSAGISARGSENSAGVFRETGFQWSEEEVSHLPWKALKSELPISAGCHWGEAFFCDNDAQALMKCFGFKQIGVLGDGVQGVVYQYENSDGHYYAVKMASEDAPSSDDHLHQLSCSNDIKANRGELVGLQLPSHPNIASIHALVMQDLSNSRRYIPVNPNQDFSAVDYQHMQLKMVVCEYVHGIDMFNAIARFPALAASPGRSAVSFVMNVFPQLLDALIFLHNHKVIHRDLKPENILMTPSGEVKIVDFGSAIQLAGRSRTNSLRGTPQTLAPEVYTQGLWYSYPADLWSLGVLLLELMAHKTGGDFQDMVMAQFTLKYPGEDIFSKSKERCSGASESSFTCRVLERFDYEDISQLFDQSVVDGRDHPQTPYLKIIVTGLLRGDPDKRMTISAIRQIWDLLSMK